MKLAVVGTGTGIGKTHLCVALLTALRAQNLLSCGMKPVESGVPPESEATNPTGDSGSPNTEPTDGDLLREASTYALREKAPYRLRAPLSPHLAARQEGIEIDLQRILAWLDTALDCPVRILETAGALLSPLTRRDANLDLVRAWRPDAIVLVAPDRLGVLHEVRAAVHLLHKSADTQTSPLGRTPLVCALQAPEVPDLSTGTNAAELAWLGVLSDIVTFPRQPPTSDDCQFAARDILTRFRVL